MFLLHRFLSLWDYSVNVILKMLASFLKNCEIQESLATNAVNCSFSFSFSGPLLYRFMPVKYDVLYNLVLICISANI